MQSPLVRAPHSSTLVEFPNALREHVNSLREERPSHGLEWTRHWTSQVDSPPLVKAAVTETKTFTRAGVDPPLDFPTGFTTFSEGRAQLIKWLIMSFVMEIESAGVPAASRCSAR